MLDQLSSAKEIVMTQSPRQHGTVDIATTARMRRAVYDGIREGRFPDDYVLAFRANQDPAGWPRSIDGRAWQVDHVFELWQGGADDINNYLPIDAELHRIKTELLEEFRNQYREPNRVEGEQVDVTQDVGRGEGE
jgi:hypothetical protein